MNTHTNKEDVIGYLEYQARIHADLHGVNAESAVKWREVLREVKGLTKAEQPNQRSLTDTAYQDAHPNGECLPGCGFHWRDRV